MPDSTVEFFEDDEDTLYVDYEGKMEVRFALEDTEEYANDLRGKTPEVRTAGMTALVLDMSFAFIEELVPIIREAACKHFELEFNEEAAEEIEDQVYELLPGFFQAAHEDEQIEE